MKKWIVLVFASACIFVVGGNCLAAYAEEMSEPEINKQTVAGDSEEMVEFSDTVVPEESSDIIEYDSDTTQESEIAIPNNLRARTVLETQIAEPYMPVNSTLERNARTILGADNRYRVTNTTAFPNRAVGHIEATFPNGSISRGTAAMVGKNVALTAGHCLYNKSRGGWASKVIYYPGRNGNALPYGSYRGRKFISSQTYLSTGNIAYDWGVIRFDSNPGGKHGYFGFQTSEANQTGKNLYTRGYPGDKPYGTMYGCAGILKGYNSNKLRMFYTLDTAGGQSGSPVYDSNQTIYAVHTHSGSTQNVGRRIDKTLYKILVDGRKW